MELAGGLIAVPGFVAGLPIVVAATIIVTTGCFHLVGVFGVAELVAVVVTSLGSYAVAVDFELGSSFVG